MTASARSIAALWAVHSVNNELYNHELALEEIASVSAYLRPSRDFTLERLARATRPLWVRLRFCFFVFFVRMWLLKACFLLILPEPVRANLFLEPELVLILGIVLLICC